MLKRLSTVLLLGGLVGLTPTAAGAAPTRPAGVPAAATPAAATHDLADRDKDHRRCMYRCDERSGRDRYRDRDRRDYERSRHRRYCWYRDRWGWYQARCGRRDRR
ncbi:MAG TPA: hypothetical protein VEG38_03065 [Acidimicrobiia bacterium]|nr:hypothetical protein [Acidimicrobiia bacterium]